MFGRDIESTLMSSHMKCTKIIIYNKIQCLSVMGGTVLHRHALLRHYSSILSTEQSRATQHWYGACTLTDAIASFVLSRLRKTGLDLGTNLLSETVTLREVQRLVLYTRCSIVLYSIVSIVQFCIVQLAQYPCNSNQYSCRTGVVADFSTVP